jgi:hypothetical protein
VFLLYRSIGVNGPIVVCLYYLTVWGASFVGLACVTVVGAMPPGPSRYCNMGYPQPDLRKWYKQKDTIISPHRPLSGSIFVTGSCLVPATS